MSDLFESFINSCLEDCINSTKTCPRCLSEKIPLDTDECYSCYEKRERRDQFNDSGV